MNLTFPYTKYGRHWPNLQILLAMWFFWFHLNETKWDSQRSNSLNCDRKLLLITFTQWCVRAVRSENHSWTVIKKIKILKWKTWIISRMPNSKNSTRLRWLSERGSMSWRRGKVFRKVALTQWSGWQVILLCFELITLYFTLLTKFWIILFNDLDERWSHILFRSFIALDTEIIL
jgi:hypothetical protein